MSLFIWMEKKARSNVQKEKATENMTDSELIRRTIADLDRLILQIMEERQNIKALLFATQRRRNQWENKLHVVN